jgi:hypothetical protein
LPANAEVIGVTEKKLQRKCEARLKQAGIEPVAHKDECLYTPKLKTNSN